MLFISIVFHLLLSTLVWAEGVEDVTVAASTTTASAPYPHQTGLIEGCSRYHRVVAGDTCWAITNRYKISLDNFYKWNPAVGEGCENLWTGYYVCIAVSTSTSSSSTRTAKPTATTPSPTQSGTPPGCPQYYQAEPGDTCISIVTNKYPEITLPDFLKWNPGVGPSCQSLLAGYYYCVAAPNVQPAPPKPKPSP